MGTPSPLQGATVLHCLARLYEIEVQGATKRATKSYTRCYIFKRAAKIGARQRLSIAGEKNYFGASGCNGVQSGATEPLIGAVVENL
jgi:hypothetical protein